MRILISAVGKSDPMTVFDNENLDVYDGAVLHIARYFHPQKVYLYMSKEICEFDAIDNRYEKALHYLDETIQVYKIKRPELVNVQRFDAFYDEFETIIDDIVEENGADVEMLCNVSSGTPAMKSAFQVISALSKYNIKAVQVDDPTKGHFKRDVDLINYEVEDYWDSNCDNHNNREDLYYSKNDAFGFVIQREMITRFISSYDYEAAYGVVKEYANRLDDDLIKLFEFAKCRAELDFDRARTLQNQLNINLLPYKADHRIELFEYALWLKRKLDREEIIDFLRGLNPFMYTSLNDLLIKYHNIHMENYCEGSNKRLTRDRLSQDATGQDILSILDETYPYGYHDKFLSEDQMLKVFEEKHTNGLLVQAIQKLDELRREKRNKASHEIVCIKSHDLDDPVDDYIKQIKVILKSLDYDVRAYWDSYDQMNQILIDKIK